MTSIIENAANGQRKAMEYLYENNKRKAYYIAESLFLNKAQAASVTVQVFQDIWGDLSASLIHTEEEFTQLVLQKVAVRCRRIISKQDKKAFRIPQNRNFLLQPIQDRDNSYKDFIEYLLSQMPTLHRFIFVLHTAGKFKPKQVVDILKLDQNTVQAAIDAEDDNISRILRSYYNGADDVDCVNVMKDFLEQEDTESLPACVDEKVAGIIDNIAAPLERKKRKRNIWVSTIVAFFSLGLVIVIALVFQSGDATANGSADTALTSFNDTIDFSENVAMTNRDTDSANDTAVNSDGSEAVLDTAHIYYADIKIQDYGLITVQLNQASAPITAANFVSLAESGFYDGLTFHRIKEGFMMQGGDPNGDGTGGSDETIVGEFIENGYDNELSHTRGAISMARSANYDSASSQFFIVHEDSTFLDGEYAVFGYVTEGMDIVDMICEAANPIDDNGTISEEEQPVIAAITIRVE